MNVVRFYETLAKIIGEREGVEIKVKVKEVTENRTVSTSENRSIAYEDEFKFPLGDGAGLGHRENFDSPDATRRAGRTGKDRQRANRGSESGARLMGA